MMKAAARDHRGGPTGGARSAGRRGSCAAHSKGCAGIAARRGLGRAAPALTRAIAVAQAGGDAGPNAVRSSTGTGIDYLALVAEKHRRSLLHRLRVADPSGALAHTSPWQTIDVITGAQLLTTAPG